MKTTVDVELYGETFTLQSDEDKDYILTISEYVNEKLSLFEESFKDSSKKNIALLVALNIADELFKEREKTKELKEKIREKTFLLLEFLEKERKEKTYGDDPLQGGINI